MNVIVRHIIMMFYLSYLVLRDNININYGTYQTLLATQQKVSFRAWLKGTVRAYKRLSQ